MERPKRQKRRLGDVVQIPLGSGENGYAWVLDEPLMAFFDYKSSEDPTVESLIEQPIAFRVWTMRKAIVSGLWKRIGTASPPAWLRKSPLFAKEDVIAKRFYRVSSGTPDVEISPEEADKLEQAAVWSQNHIEDRLRDHFTGVPNKWVELMRPRSLRNKTR